MTLLIGITIGLLVGILIMFLLMRFMINSMQSSLEKQFNHRLEAFSKSQDYAHLNSIQLKEKEFLEKEKKIRLESAEKSRSVRLGSVAEKLIPVSGKLDYEPEDMIFLGRPIDYLVFNGMSSDNVDSIVFLEIKTGSSNLSKRERQIEKCVNDKKIVFKTVRLEKD